MKPFRTRLAAARKRSLLARAWRRARADTAYGLAGDDLHAVRRDLEMRVAAWPPAAEGLGAVRTEIMNGVDRLVLYRAFLELSPEARTAVRERLAELPRDAAAAGRQIAADEMRIAVLRQWARLGFGDYARGDWYDVYRRAADLQAAAMRRHLERLNGAAPAAALAHRDAAAYGLNTALRLRLLRVPAGRPIERRGARSRLRRLFRRTYDEKPTGGDRHGG